MNVTNWIELSGVVISIIGIMYATLRSSIIFEVKEYVRTEIQKLKDERIAELLRENERLTDKNERLKEYTRDSK